MEGDLKLFKKIKVLNSLEKCLLEKPDVAFITNETAFHIPVAIKVASAGVKKIKYFF